MGEKTGGPLRLRSMTSIYIARGNELLMLYRIGSRVVPPSWCGIGGHFEPEELCDPQACVLRELREEAHLGPEALADLRLRYLALRQRPGEIRQNYYYFARLAPGVEVDMRCDEGRLQWLPFDEALLEREMPLSAKEVLRHYLRVGRSTEAVYAGIASGGAISFQELNVF
ncbi:MAG: NUDIX domain-containing protein [Provencibacterium sp.]|nr:NUDIX domain-containing protein [Provencibacterium sp.]